MTAREVIATTNCPVRRRAAHDHTHCLIEADVLIQSLELAGYQLVGVADLKTLTENR